MLVWLLNQSQLVQRVFWCISACVLTLAIALVIFAPIAWLWVQMDEVRAGRERLGTIKSSISAFSTVPLAADEIIKTDLVMSGSSSAVIQAELQSRLEAMATSSNVTIISAGTASGPTSDTINYVGTRATVSGSVNALQSLLYRIETATPLLIVSNARFIASSRPPADTATRPMVQAQLTVAAAYDLVETADD